MIKKFGNITLIEDDCMNVLRSLPNGSFDDAIENPEEAVSIFDLNKTI